MLADLFAPIAVFGSIFGICYIYFITRNRERMAMIEKGIGAELFNSKPKPKFTFWALKIGMLILGIGIGLILGIYFAQGYHQHEDKLVVYWGFVMSLGGLGLIISFIIESIMTKKQK
jgi:multisubunit Na+/H+ antiporter MnhB subunit